MSTGLLGMSNDWADVALATTPVIPNPTPNTPPRATIDFLSSVAEDSGQRTITVASLLQNDIDSDGDTLTLTGVSDAVGGTVSRSGGNIFFTPTANFAGPAGFTYAISDGEGGSASGQVSFTITQVNDLPVAGDDTLSSVAEDSGARSIAGSTLLANDVDADGTTISIASVGNAVGGTVSLSLVALQPTITFTPAANFTGTASFDYTIKTANAQTPSLNDTDTATVSFQVTAVNDAPVATDDKLTPVAEDSGQRSIAFATLTANDVDVDGDSLTITSVGGAVGGTASISGNAILFTPAADFSGDASFTYTVSDGHGGTDTAKVGFDITPVNDAPLAVDDELSPIVENSGQMAVAFSLLTGNDSDPEGDSLTVSAVGSAIGGAVSISGSNVLFTPTAHFSGNAGFTYTLSDGHGGTDTAKASFVVTEINDPPEAADDTLPAVVEDSGQRSIAFTTLLANDSDPENDMLTISQVGSAVGGTVSISGSSVLFKPTANFNGEAGFTYTVSDGRGGTDTAGVSFDVTAVNDAPLLANHELGSVAEDSGQRSISFATLLDGSIDIDGDSLTVSSVGDAVGGTVSISGSNVLFTPAADFNGQARFSFTASDGHGGTDTASVTFNVTPVNDAPVAQDDELSSVAEDSGQRQIAFSTLTGNDQDVEGNTLTVAGVSAAVGGTVSISGSNVLFTPTANFNGEAGFTYTVSDGKGGTDTAAVTFEVAAVNDRPVAADDSLSDIAEDSGPRQIVFSALTGNDDDVDGDSLTVTAVDDAVGGTVSISGGAVVFTPEADFNGEAGFTYTVSDGHGGTDTAKVGFDITPVNDAPVFGPMPSVQLNEDSGPVSGKFTATDPEGHTVTFSGSFSSQLGSLSVASNGDWTFTVGSYFQSLSPLTGVGFDTLVTANDGHGGASQGFFTILVGGLNDAPVAGDDSFETTKNGVLDDSNVITNAAGVDKDVDSGDKLSVAAVNGTAGKVGVAVAGSTGGLFTIAANGALTFDPNGDYASLTSGQTATSSVTYTLADSFGGTDTATVTVTISGSNDDPVATNDPLGAVAEDSGQRSIAFATLLANDSDPDNDTLTVTQVGNAVGGAVAISGSTVVFTPAANFNGAASFSYTVSDGQGGTDVATASFTVTAVNDAPTAQDDALAAVDEDSGQRSIAFSTLTGNDQDVEGDTLTVTGVSDAIGGAVLISGSNVLFTPTANFNGEAGFTYTVSDGKGGTDTATASFDVNPVNDTPVAQDDVFTAVEDNPLTDRNVITHSPGADTDVDGHALTVVGVGAASGHVGTTVAGSNGGLFTIAADGSLTFAPDGNFETLFAGQTAVTSVSYTVSDGHGGTDSATVTVTITGAAEADLFTGGDDTRDLNAFNLAAYTNAQVTKALAGKDVVQLSQTQKLGTVFEAGAGNDTVTGSSSTDRIHGDAGKDSLLGQNGDDTLWGDAGDDSLAGGNGHDTLYGGAGSDTLTGGNGNDAFLFEDAGTETITDFGFGVGASGKDVIDLRSLSLADWTGSDSQITVAGSGSSRTIYVDLNDDGNAANNATQAELVIQVSATFVRGFIVSDVNPLADILV